MTNTPGTGLPDCMNKLAKYICLSLYLLFGSFVFLTAVMMVWLNYIIQEIWQPSPGVIILIYNTHPTFSAWVLSASLFHDPSGRTNDMHTMAYATFRYDTAEVENWLNFFELVSTFKKDHCATVEGIDSRFTQQCNVMFYVYADLISFLAATSQFSILIGQNMQLAGCHNSNEMRNATCADNFN